MVRAHHCSTRLFKALQVRHQSLRLLLRGQPCPQGVKRCEVLIVGANFLRKVEVEELPLTVAITKELTEGAATAVEKKECKNIGCNSFEICTNTALQNEKIYTVKKVYGKMECPKHHVLYKVDVTDS